MRIAYGPAFTGAYASKVISAEAALCFTATGTTCSPSVSCHMGKVVFAIGQPLDLEISVLIGDGVEGMSE